MKVAICLCTYKRPSGLRRQLRAIAAAEKPPLTEIIVVDNACEESTARIVHEETPSARLIHEARRGIAAARNTSFYAALHLGADLICTVDDDDEVTPNWLVELVKTYLLSKPDLVLGNIIDEAGRSRSHPRSSSNAMQSRRILERMGHPWVDPARGLTGGADRQMFEAILALGGSMARCRTSIVRRNYCGHRVTAYGRFLHGIKFGYTGLAVPDDNICFLTTNHGKTRDTYAALLRRAVLHTIKCLLQPGQPRRYEKCLVSLGRLAGATLYCLNLPFNYYSKQTAERSGSCRSEGRP